MKKIVILLLFIFLIGTVIWVTLDIENPALIVEEYAQKVADMFWENESDFIKLKSYYETLDYKSIFRNEKSVRIDGVTYRIVEYDDMYQISTTEFESFGEEFISASGVSVQELLEDPRVIRISVDKETYEMKVIGIDVSKLEYGVYMHIFWEEEESHPYFGYYDVILKDGWQITGQYDNI